MGKLPVFAVGTSGGGYPAALAWRPPNEVAPDCVIVIDAAGFVRYFGPESEAVFGFPEAEVLAQNIDLLLPTSDREGRDRGVRHLFGLERRPGDVFERVVTGRRRDGSTFPVGLAVRDVRPRGERLFTAAIRDLTPRLNRDRRREEPQPGLVQAPLGAEVDHLAAALVQTLIRPLARVIEEFSVSRGPRRIREHQHARQVAALLVEVAERAAKMLLHLGATEEQGCATMRASPGTRLGRLPETGDGAAKMTNI